MHRAQRILFCSIKRSFSPKQTQNAQKKMATCDLNKEKTEFQQNSKGCLKFRIHCRFVRSLCRRRIDQQHCQCPASDHHHIYIAGYVRFEQDFLANAYAVPFFLRNSCNAFSGQGFNLFRPERQTRADPWPGDFYPHTNLRCSRT